MCIFKAQSLINGQANTNALVSQSGHISSAAKLCNDYTNTESGTGVYSDWYLPAIWELNQCYINAFILNTILGSTNGFIFSKNNRDTYWSSTECNATSVYYLDFGDNGMGMVGYLESGAKAYTCRVRAVRRF